MSTIGLTVDGQRHTVEVGARTRLAAVLRDELAITGVKVACAEGTCGACTVLVDGRPTLSCILIAQQVDGHEITTVEGLAGADGELSALQEAFIAEDAFQCGFCTGGQLLSATALLRDNPSPSPDDVRAALAGNLCRCGAYPKIERAVLRAAEATA